MNSRPLTITAILFALGAAVLTWWMLEQPGETAKGRRNPVRPHFAEGLHAARVKPDRQPKPLGLDHTLAGVQTVDLSNQTVEIWNLSGLTGEDGDTNFEYVELKNSGQFPANGLLIIGQDYQPGADLPAAAGGTIILNEVHFNAPDGGMLLLPGAEPEQAEEQDDPADDASSPEEAR